MELRTREEQRELDTGRVTLRETGRELQRGGKDLRTEHIDRSKCIDINRMTESGAWRAVEERERNAESRSPDIAYALRTLPSDLRNHWNSLSEARQREILEKAYASANRKESGEFAAASLQAKNLIRRYGNSQRQTQKSNSGQSRNDNSSLGAGKTPYWPVKPDDNDAVSEAKKKAKPVRSKETVESVLNNPFMKDTVRTKAQEETSELPMPIRQHSLRIEQTGRKKNTDHSSPISDRKTEQNLSGQNIDQNTPASGYETRLARRKRRSRNGFYTKDQGSEISDEEVLSFRMKEAAIGQRPIERTDDRTTAQTIGKEYGKRETLKKNEKVSEEKTGLRIVDNDVEDGTKLRITVQDQDTTTGLRTTERNPAQSTRLRTTGMTSGAGSVELRTLQAENFQKSDLEEVLEKNPHTGSGKETQRKENEQEKLSAKAPGRKATSNRKSSGKGREKTKKDEKGSEQIREESSGVRKSRRTKNTPEEAAPSSGNKNSAVRLVRRKKKEKGAGTANKHFVSSFTNLIKADFTRAGVISQEKKRIQAESSLQEYQDQTASRAVRIAVTPLRIAAKKAVRAAAKKIAAGIASAVAAAINMLLPALVIILPILLIAGILPGLMGSLVAEEEEGEGESYNVSGGSIVEYARQWIGKTKYIYGAGRNGPLDWQDYADCSSFVHGVFSHFGVEIGWTTMEQENSGSKVCENSLSNAQPGDIVLFYDGGSIRAGGSGHVGIFSGGGNMVHNSSSSGTVIEAPVSYQNRPYVVRRITVPFKEDRSGGGGNATSGHRRDPTNYSQSQLELIWAIVAQEDNGSYKGALAVISSAMNRTESSKWGYCGKTAMEQLTAPGQYCYSNDTYWMARLGGNVPDYVKTAVNDCLKKGIRNHNHTSFRSTKGKVTGPDAVQIGGNWFFDH